MSNSIKIIDWINSCQSLEQVESLEKYIEKAVLNDKELLFKKLQKKKSLLAQAQ